VVECIAEAPSKSRWKRRWLDATTVARLPRLKLIATGSTGYDHIDVQNCRAHGITVCNVPDYGDSTIAEHVFALLPAISRHLIEAVRAAASSGKLITRVRPHGPMSRGGWDRADRAARCRDRERLRDEAEIFRGGQYSQADLRTLLASNVLLTFPNVLVRPHNAYNTEDAVDGIIETTLANIEAFARGAGRSVVS
jgi:lactate dehydrogenase-like 2-hydroxyacid dehydrogenase